MLIKHIMPVECHHYFDNSGKKPAKKSWR